MVAAAASACLTLPSSVTSTLENLARSPSASATRAPNASLTSAMITLPPAATIIRAVASPSPEAPPVTKNTELSNGFNLARLLHRSPHGVVVVGQIYRPVRQARTHACERTRVIRHLEVCEFQSVRRGNHDGPFSGANLAPLTQLDQPRQCDARMRTGDHAGPVRPG